MADNLVSQAAPRMDKAIEHLQQDISSLRTGRASVSLVDAITVEQFGQTMPLKAVATMSTPDARTIMISAWDKTLVPVIEKALRDSQSLGLNPSNDGQVIRLNIPPMTTERREEIVRQLGEKIEACHITLRNIRHDILSEARNQEKSKQISQDEVKDVENDLNKLIDKYRDQIEALRRAKAAEIMEV